MHLGGQIPNADALCVKQHGNWKRTSLFDITSSHSISSSGVWNYFIGRAAHAHEPIHARRSPAAVLRWNNLDEAFSSPISSSRKEKISSTHTFAYFLCLVLSALAHNIPMVSFSKHLSARHLQRITSNSKLWCAKNVNYVFLVVKFISWLWEQNLNNLFQLRTKLL
jgi:Trehalose receptor